jgi:hypothetical protein
MLPREAVQSSCQAGTPPYDHFPEAKSGQLLKSLLRDSHPHNSTTPLHTHPLSTRWFPTEKVPGASRSSHDCQLQSAAHTTWTEGNSNLQLRGGWCAAGRLAANPGTQIPAWTPDRRFGGAGAGSSVLHQPVRRTSRVAQCHSKWHKYQVGSTIHNLPLGTLGPGR